MDTPPPAPQKPPPPQLTPEELAALKPSPARIAITVVLLALVWGSTVAVYQLIQSHLDDSLYVPACNTACAKSRARHHSHRAAGKGHPGRVSCWCNGPAVSDWRGAPADLSNGSMGDLVLHWGGQETITGLLFIAGGLIALWVGNPGLAKMARRRR